ncbi:hypothetical protein [Flavobacterium sp.]|jgi:hypothetical protein|uniref:hypothetical protein n=1 Tax=Flavobacterium sp. TaxID=239 RepID=UPI0037BE51FE
MNISHFFFQLSYSTALKNKLQQEAYQYLKSLNQNVIHADDIQQAQKIILEELEKINQKYPRCKALNVSFNDRSQREMDNKIYLSGFPEVTFHIIPGELKHMSCLPYKSLSNN